MTTLMVTSVGVLGLLIGSFLNVVIYRVPRGLSIVTPRSSCPHCATPIRERDNIPIISWLLLRGRCRDCGAPISIRYPLLEALTAILFAATAARVGPHWELPALLATVAALIALAAIDLELLTLPRKIIYVALAIVAASLTLAALLEREWHRLLVAGLCAASWFAFFYLLNWVAPKALGRGDVRLAALLGLSLGWLGVGHVFVGFFAANLIGLVVGIVLIAMRKLERRQPIPYGVFLALGFGVAFFAGSEIISWFPRPA